MANAPKLDDETSPQDTRFLRAARAEGPRPRRGSPEQTRRRLIHTAAQLFNQVPYWETDSNQIAKAANYSTGTFYRHFKDKREVFIAAYREWVQKSGPTSSRAWSQARHLKKASIVRPMH